MTQIVGKDGVHHPLGAVRKVWLEVQYRMPTRFKEYPLELWAQLGPDLERALVFVLLGRFDSDSAAVRALRHVQAEVLRARCGESGDVLWRIDEATGHLETAGGGS